MTFIYIKIVPMSSTFSSCNSFDVWGGRFLIVLVWRRDCLILKLVYLSRRHILTVVIEDSPSEFFKKVLLPVEGCWRLISALRTFQSRLLIRGSLYRLHASKKISVSTAFRIPWWLTRMELTTRSRLMCRPGSKGPIFLYLSYSGENIRPWTFWSITAFCS